MGRGIAQVKEPVILAEMFGAVINGPDIGIWKETNVDQHLGCLLFFQLLLTNPWIMKGNDCAFWFFIYFLELYIH